MKPSGTKEWSSHSYNIGKGCSHNCIYCYARYNVLHKFGQIKTAGEWKNEKILEHKVYARQPKRTGTIMFPTTHDLTPYYLAPAIVVLKKMLESGNRVLIVSKPHIECITDICIELDKYKDQILFRFTIGSLNNDILKFWEPGAPSFEERFACLKYAFNNGFQASVSCEPMLDDIVNTRKLYHTLVPYVTDSIWFGKMNHVRERVCIDSLDVEKMVSMIEQQQTNGQIFELYHSISFLPKIKWKDSIKKVVGIKTPDKPGMDI